MEAAGSEDMTIGSWEEHLEALGDAVMYAVSSEHWNHVQRFGPNTGGFSMPAVCYMLPMTQVQLGSLAEFLVQNFPWFKVNLTIYRAVMFDDASQA